MRTFLFLWSLISIYCTGFAQAYQLRLENAYGAGSYLAGDTVTIFSRELAEEEYFEAWDFSEEKIQYVFDSGEWRTQFIMPAQDLVVKTIIKSLQSGFLQFEEVMGENNLKPVYYAFPENPKGTVFFFHGTGGQASGWIGQRKDQNYALVKECFAAGYGVLITESEESTLGRDLNGDDKIRWQSFPLNSNTNIEYQNLDRIIQVFEDRGLIDRNRLFSIGMSNGGSFSGTFSFMFNTIASVIYCASSQTTIVENTDASLLFCMMPNDAIIGEEGNEGAFLNSAVLRARGICAPFFMNKPYPIYPEYFARIGLSVEQSAQVVQELSVNGFIDAKGYTLAPVSTLESDFLSNPGRWPVLRGLPMGSLGSVGGLYNLADAGHVFYANHNKRTITFLDQACTEVITSSQQLLEYEQLEVFPNPSTQQIQLNWSKAPVGKVDYQIIDLWGRVQQQGKVEKGSPIKLSDISQGYYLIKLRDQAKQYWARFYKASAH